MKKLVVNDWRKVANCVLGHAQRMRIQETTLCSRITRWTSQLIQFVSGSCATSYSNWMVLLGTSALHPVTFIGEGCRAVAGSNWTINFAFICFMPSNQGKRNLWWSALIDYLTASVRGFWNSFDSIRPPLLFWSDCGCVMPYATVSSSRVVRIGTPCTGILGKSLNSGLYRLIMV